MFNPISIIISSAIISGTYFLLDFDFNYWVYVGIYSGLYTLISMFYAFLYTSAGAMGIGSAIIYVLINAIVYFVLGMGVVWIIREFKDDSDGKFTIGIGVIVQYMLMLVVNGIFGSIFSL